MHASASPLRFEPRATFDKLWVDYDVTQDDILGMTIHVKFTAYDMKDMDSYLAIYFQHSDGDKSFLKDKNDKFVSSAGDVALYKSIKPAYNPAVYEDLSVFMPYGELDLSPGEYKLSMDVKLIYKAGGVISKLTTYDFEYTKPGSTTGGSPGAPATVADAKFEKVWVDYDVTEDGKKGMRIHVKFSLINLKDVDAYMAIYFTKKNGDVIKGTSSVYRSTNGQAAVFKSLKAGYDESVYDDLKLFMPYNEFNLGTGKFDLNMDVSVIYKNGDLVKQLTTKEFWFSQ